MSEKIMVIDDDNCLLTVLKETFALESIDAKTFDNHHDALEEAKRADYDLFLIDLKLPEIDGIELLKMLKQMQKTARFIIMTGYGDMATAISAFKAGVSDFILKPFKVDEMISSVRNQLNEKSAIDQHLTKWGNVVKSTGISYFNDIFQTLDVEMIEKIDNYENMLKELSSGYNLISRKNIKILNRIAKKAKKEKKLATEMISYISHEIRSPLNSILGYTRTLLMQSESGRASCLNEFLNEILMSSLYVLDLTNSILNSALIDSKATTLEFEQIDINKLLRDIRSSFKLNMEEKSLSYKQYISPNIPAIIADRLKLSQILHNLIDNAIKYSPAGAVSIEVKLSGDKNAVLFVVQDTGIGISYKDKSKLFKKFARLNPNEKKGTGLGLSTAKRLVELHGGKIWLESRLNQGSAFYFTLPLVPSGQAFSKRSGDEEVKNISRG